MARVVEPANTLATIALVVETREDGVAIVLYDIRLLYSIESGQLYSAAMFIDDAVVSPVVQGAQVYPMSRGVTADWP